MQAWDFCEDLPYVPVSRGGFCRLGRYACLPVNLPLVIVIRRIFFWNLCSVEASVVVPFFSESRQSTFSREGYSGGFEK